MPFVFRVSRSRRSSLASRSRLSCSERSTIGRAWIWEGKRVMVQVGLIDGRALEIQPGSDFPQRGPVRSSLLPIIEGALKISPYLGSDGEHLLHHLDVGAHAFGLGFKQGQAEVYAGLWILGVEFHREAS